MSAKQLTPQEAWAHLTERRREWKRASIEWTREDWAAVVALYDALHRATAPRGGKEGV